MSSIKQIEQLQAEIDYYHDRVALLRAKLYRWGLGSTARLRELEAALERARWRLREERAREDYPPSSSAFWAANSSSVRTPRS